MQHVLLRHEGDVLFKGLEIGMQIHTIEQDRSLARQRPTGHDVHQRRLACAVGSDDTDEFGRADSHAGAMQDALLCRRPGPVDPHIIADAPHLQLDIATLPRPERGTIERQFEGADIDAIPRDQGLGAAHELAVDVGAVRAAEVAHHDRSTRYFEFGVAARNIWMIQHDLARHRLTADCQAVVERPAIGRTGGDGPCRRPPDGRRRSPHLPQVQHRPLDDGDAVISPQASVRSSPSGGNASPTAKYAGRSSSRGPPQSALSGSPQHNGRLHRQRYPLPLFVAVQNCTLDASFAPARRMALAEPPTCPSRWFTGRRGLMAGRRPPFISTPRSGAYVHGRLQLFTLPTLKRPRFTGRRVELRTRADRQQPSSSIARRDQLQRFDQRGGRIFCVPHHVHLAWRPQGQIVARPSPRSTGNARDRCRSARPVNSQILGTR